MSATATNLPAQTALGKFYLHPWDSQVLVDWATSLVQKGTEETELVKLSKMDKADREAILDQFGTVVLVNNIALSFDEFTAVSAYLNDLRTRVLAEKIDPEAAFAQVRPLAYDMEGIRLTGLSELDEDLNLIDSGEAPFHHTDLVKSNKDVFIRRFFSEMRILEPIMAYRPRARRSNSRKRGADTYPGTDLLLILALAFLFYLLILLLTAA